VQNQRPKTWVIIEDNSEQVMGFSFVPIGSWDLVRDAW
jgi:hypothetical protein